MAPSIFSWFAGALLLLPTLALGESAPYFAGLDISAGLATGTSSTTDGGADFGGGGVVNNVQFAPSGALGGHMGYRIDPTLSTFVSYQHIRGGVSWDADFAMIGVTSLFKGSAISDVIMANIALDQQLSEATSVAVHAGLGLSVNRLSAIVETDVGTGMLVSDVAEHALVRPAARIGIGIEHKIAAQAALGLNASVSYIGGFKTGDTRSGNMGVTEITPYGIDAMWRTSLGASLKLTF